MEAIIKNTRSVLLTAANRGNYCTTDEIYKLYSVNMGAVKFEEIGCKDFNDVLHTMKSMGYVDKAQNKWFLTDTTGMSNTARNIQDSNSNRKVTSFNKMIGSGLPGRESNIKNTRRNPQYVENTQRVPPYVENLPPKRQEQSRFSAPPRNPLQNNHNNQSYQMNYNNQINHNHQIIQSHPMNYNNQTNHNNRNGFDYSVRVYENSNVTNSMFPPMTGPPMTGPPMTGPPPGLGIEFIYEKRMIALLKHAFPCGLLLQEILDNLDVGSISSKLGLQDMKNILEASEEVYYDSLVDKCWGRPTVEQTENKEGACDNTIRKFIIEILDDSQKEMSLTDLTKRIRVDSKIGKQPSAVIYKALIDCDNVKSRGAPPNVFYSLENHSENQFYEKASLALEKINLADESYLAEIYSKQNMPRVGFNLHESVDVIISDFRDFSCFSVRLLPNEMAFEALSADLQRHCENMAEQAPPHDLAVSGEILAIRNADVWHRGEVLYGGSKKMILVRTIDVGHCFYENLPSNNILPLPDRFKTDPFAFQCTVETGGADEDEIAFRESGMKDSLQISLRPLRKMRNDVYSTQVKIEGVCLPDDFYGS